MALVRGGSFSQAVVIFDRLDFMQKLDDKPAVLLAFGNALAATGDKSNAQSTLAAALDLLPNPEVSHIHTISHGHDHPNRLMND